MRFEPAAHQPSNATTPSISWAPHSMTREYPFDSSDYIGGSLNQMIMVNDGILSSFTVQLHCASIVHPETPPLSSTVADVDTDSDTDIDADTETDTLWVEGEEVELYIVKRERER